MTARLEYADHLAPKRARVADEPGGACLYLDPDRAAVEPMPVIDVRGHAVQQRDHHLAVAPLPDMDVGRQSEEPRVVRVEPPGTRLMIADAGDIGDGSEAHGAPSCWAIGVGYVP